MNRVNEIVEGYRTMIDNNKADDAKWLFEQSQEQGFDYTLDEIEHAISTQGLMQVKYGESLNFKNK